MSVKKKEDKYKLAFELHTGKAHVAVYEPVISKQEHEHRMHKLRNATRSFMTSYYRNKEKRRKER